MCPWVSHKPSVPKDVLIQPFSMRTSTMSNKSPNKGNKIMIINTAPQIHGLKSVYYLPLFYFVSNFLLPYLHTKFQQVFFHCRQPPPFWSSIFAFPPFLTPVPSYRVHYRNFLQHVPVIFTSAFLQCMVYIWLWLYGVVIYFIFGLLYISINSQFVHISHYRPSVCTRPNISRNILRHW